MNVKKMLEDQEKEFIAKFYATHGRIPNEIETNIYWETLPIGAMFALVTTGQQGKANMIVSALKEVLKD